LAETVHVYSLWLFSRTSDIQKGKREQLEVIKGEIQMRDELDQSKWDPKLVEGLKQMKVNLGFAKPEPVVEEAKEEEKEATKLVKETEDMNTWSEEQLTAIAESDSEMSKDAKAILNERAGYVSPETEAILKLRKDLSKERNADVKAKAEQAAAEADKALRDRARSGDRAAMNELLLPVKDLIYGGSKGDFDVDGALEASMKAIEAQNKAKNKGK
jgi:hypothetical protein